MKIILTILVSVILLLCAQAGLEHFDNYCSKRLSDARHVGYNLGREDGSIVGREALERLHKADLENATKIWIMSEGEISDRHYHYIRDFDRAKLFDSVDSEVKRLQ